jgi:hypothetical protein
MSSRALLTPPGASGRDRPWNIGYTPHMKVLSAKIKNGRLELPECSVREGDVVTVLVPEPDGQSFTLTGEERARLEAAIAQADRGEGVDGWELLGELSD